MLKNIKTKFAFIVGILALGVGLSACGGEKSQKEAQPINDTPAQLAHRFYPLTGLTPTTALGTCEPTVNGFNFYPNNTHDYIATTEQIVDGKDIELEEGITYVCDKDGAVDSASQSYLLNSSPRAIEIMEDGKALTVGTCNVNANGSTIIKAYGIETIIDGTVTSKGTITGDGSENTVMCVESVAPLTDETLLNWEGLPLLDTAMAEASSEFGKPF